MNMQLPTRRPPSAMRSAAHRSHRDHEATFAAEMRALMARTKGRPAIRDLLDLGEQWELDQVRFSASAEVLVRLAPSR